MTTAPLTEALARLVEVARAVGLPEADARLEGLQLSATVSEPARGAFRDWAEQTGEVGGAERFFDCASRGRRWRSSPTTSMTQLAATDPEAAGRYADALASVAAAACLLGEPHPQVAGTATLATAAQRSVVPTAFQPDPVAVATPATPAPPTSPSSSTPAPTPPSAPSTPAADQPAMPGAGGVDPSRVQGMADRSREAADAMGDFTKRAPDILQNVLGQLRGTQDRMRDLGMRTADVPAGLSANTIDLSGLDPHAPGAFTGITAGPAAQPDAVAPGTGPAPAAAPVATQPDPDATPADEEKEPEPPAKSLDELLAELDALVGLASVKTEIHRQTAILRVQGLRAKAGLQDPTITRHLVFVGNPGTGKTTVARLVAGIYKALGLLSKGQLVEVDRSELVAGYLGQTAIKTAEVAEKAKGGVLFIDEAYSLSGDQYGEEAINTLVKEMEDNRHDLVVIVAGYPRPMATFIAENPGLASRFRTTIDFDDYTDDELVGIFRLMAQHADYDLTDDAVTAFRVRLAEQTRDETFGNGRFARNTLEAAIGRHAWRLRDVAEPTLDDLRTILPEDVSGTSDADPVEFGPADAGDATPTDAPPGDEPVDPDAPAWSGEGSPEPAHAGSGDEAALTAPVDASAEPSDPGAAAPWGRGTDDGAPA